MTNIETIDTLNRAQVSESQRQRRPPGVLEMEADEPRLVARHLDALGFDHYII